MAATLRVLFDLGHPAHYHLFKHAARRLMDAGCEVLLLGRQKDCLPELLAGSGLPHRIIPRVGRGLTALARENLRALDLVVRKLSRPRFDVMLGTSIVIPLAARLTGSKSVVFCEDDALAVPLFALLAYGPAHYIATPAALAHEKHGRKHLTYRGFQKLAYLHPDLFQPDPAIRADLGLEAGQKYYLLRLVALEAHHDVGQRGLSAEQARYLLDRLGQCGRVFISSEKPLPAELAAYRLPTKPERIFDVMASAEMVIGDSQSMTVEAALLGTPSLRCNTFVGRLSVMRELEDRYGLTAGFRPEDFDALKRKLEDWLARPDLKEEWSRRRAALLADCVNPTEWILALVERLGQRR
jgi:predicted glycosyltransferase